MRHVCGLMLLVTLTLTAGCARDDAKIKALEERVAALEAAAKAPKVQRLTIIDEAGKERAMIGLRDEDKTPALRLKDASGRNRALLRLHANGMPTFVMWGDGGKGTAYLAVPGEGPPNMMFFNGKGKQVHKVPAR